MHRVREERRPGPADVSGGLRQDPALSARVQASVERPAGRGATLCCLPQRGSRARRFRGATVQAARPPEAATRHRPGGCRAALESHVAWLTADPARRTSLGSPNRSALPGTPGAAISNLEMILVIEAGPSFESNLAGEEALPVVSGPNKGEYSDSLIYGLNSSGSPEAPSPSASSQITNRLPSFFTFYTASSRRLTMPAWRSVWRSAGRSSLPTRWESQCFLSPRGSYLLDES